MGRVVKAPLVVAKRSDGSDVYVYEGGRLPDGLAEGEVARLVDFLADEAAPEGSLVPQKPAGNAGLGAWQDYARSMGADEATIDGKTRDELREQFGA